MSCDIMDVISRDLELKGGDGGVSAAALTAVTHRETVRR